MTIRLPVDHELIPPESFWPGCAELIGNRTSKAIGLDVVLYCTNPVPDEEQVLKIVRPLEAAGFYIVVIVDTELALSLAPPGRIPALPYLLIQPPTFMGPPMDTVEQLTVWLDRVRPGIQSAGVPSEEA